MFIVGLLKDGFVKTPFLQSFASSVQKHDGSVILMTLSRNSTCSNRDKDVLGIPATKKSYSLHESSSNDNSISNIRSTVPLRDLLASQSPEMNDELSLIGSL